MSIDNVNFRRARRAYWILLAGLLVIALWAYFTMPRVQGSGNGNSAGISGSGNGEGAGSGSGGDGDGPGSGSEGDGPGNGEQGEGAGAGTGEDATQPEGEHAGENPPAEESHAENGEAETERKGAPEGEAPREPLPDVPEVHSLQPVEPIVQQTPQSGGGSVEGRRGFYGMTVNRNKKVLFLVDVSGSMGDWSQEFPGKTKIEVLKMELTKNICGGRMKPTSATYENQGGFIIICFSDGANAIPQEKLYRYSRRNDVKQALEEVDKLTANGGTGMEAGWSLALDRMMENRIDTVYFMSDGVASFSVERLEAMMKEKKFSRKLQVNCISIGQDSEILKKIGAKYGKYTWLP